MPLCLSASLYLSKGVSCPWGTCGARGGLPGSWGTESDGLTAPRDMAFQRADRVSDGGKNPRRHGVGNGVKRVMGTLSWGWSGAASQTGWRLSRDLRKCPLAKEQCVARGRSMCKGPVVQHAWHM